MSSSGEGGDSEQHVRHRAYAIWEAKGRPHGDHLEHWRQAIREIEQAKEAPETPADAAPGGVITEAEERKAKKLPPS
jgi:hypothetical protein